MAIPDASQPAHEQIAWAAQNGERNRKKAIQLLEEVLMLSSISLAERHEAMRLLAWYKFWSGETDVHKRVEALLALNPAPSIRMDIMSLQALIIDRSGDTSRAIAELHALVDHCRASNMDRELARAGNHLGFIMGRSGQIEQALILHLEALRAARRTHYSAEEAASLMHMGIIHHRRGQINDARNLWLQALERAEQGDFLKIQSICHNNLAVFCEFTGDYDRAIAHHTQSIALKELLEDPLGRATSINNLGFVYFRLHRLEDALACLGEAGQEAERLQNPWLQSYVAYGNSRVYRLQQQYALSLTHALISLEHRRKLKASDLVAASLIACCDAVLATENPQHPQFPEVAGWYHEATELCRTYTARDVHIELCRVGAAYSRLLGREQEAIAYEKRYQELLEQVNNLATPK